MNKESLFVQFVEAENDITYMHILHTSVYKEHNLQQHTAALLGHKQTRDKHLWFGVRKNDSSVCVCVLKW